MACRNHHASRLGRAVKVDCDDILIKAVMKPDGRASQRRSNAVNPDSQSPQGLRHAPMASNAPSNILHTYYLQHKI